MVKLENLVLSQMLNQLHPLTQEQVKKKVINQVWAKMFGILSDPVWSLAHNKVLVRAQVWEII